MPAQRDTEGRIIDIKTKAPVPAAPTDRDPLTSPPLLMARLMFMIVPLSLIHAPATMTVIRRAAGAAAMMPRLR